MAPRTLFEKFGHHCEIQSKEREFAQTSDNVGAIRRLFDRLRMINETDKFGYNFLRSQKKIENEHRKMMGHPFLIHPFSDLMQFRDIFISIVMLIQFLMIPLDVAFFNMRFPNNFVHSKAFIAVRLTTDALSMADVVFTFFCAYCDEKNTVVVVCPKKIARHYLKTSFILDVYSSISIDVIANLLSDIALMQEYYRFFLIIHYIGLIALGRYYYFVKKSAKLFERSERSFIIHRVGIAVLTFIIYLHLISCCCITWTIYQVPWTSTISNSFLGRYTYGKTMKTQYEVYIRFLFCGILMILDAGLGFTCFINAAYCFTTNMWIVSKLLYILVIAYFMQLHTAMFASTVKYNDMLSEVKDYMRHRQIPDFLQKRITCYYDIKFQGHYFRESEILNTVSGQLRQEIIMNTCQKLVESMGFFKDLPITLLVRIVSCLKYDIFLTNDVITKVDCIGDSMYFIANGTVAVYSKTGKEICHLHDGDYFGEIALIMKDSFRVASVVAAEVCELYRLDRNDFVKAILPFPDLYEKIAHIASERLEHTFIADEANKGKTDRNVRPVGSLAHQQSSTNVFFKSAKGAQRNRVLSI